MTAQRLNGICNPSRKHDRKQEGGQQDRPKEKDASGNSRPNGAGDSIFPLAGRSSPADGGNGANPTSRFFLSKGA